MEYFLQRQGRILGRVLTITPEAMAALCKYNWPGNIRELENLLIRVTYLMPSSTITFDDLPLDVRQMVEHVEPSEQLVVQKSSPIQSDQQRFPLVTGKAAALKEQSMNTEVQAILAAWHASNGHITRAAAILGISRTTLWRKMVKYGLSGGKDSSSL